jgi:hypothetical protein
MKLRAKASIWIAFGLCIFCSGARGEGWDSIGPFGATLSNNDVISGQMNALAIDPRDANILYAGAAEGGVWKTSNGGASWTPLTDTQLVRKLASGKLRGTLSIGSLAVNPSLRTLFMPGPAIRTSPAASSAPASACFALQMPEPPGLRPA